MANTKQHYKNNMQKYRVWKGLLQKDIATDMNISISEIRLIERNEVCPSKKNRIKICDYFGVSFEQMFYLDKDEVENED